MVYSFLYLCRSDGMADVTDSKSVGSDTVWVRVPPSAPRRSKVRFAPVFFLPAAKKDAIRTLPCSSFPTATRFAGSQLAGRPAGGKKRGRPLCSGVFFCLRQKRRHPHAPLLLLSNCDPLCWLAVGRPPCGRHSSPIGGLGGSRSFSAGSLCSGVFFLPAAKKTPSARSLGDRFAGSQLAGRLRAAFRYFSVRFAPIFFVPGKKRHPHARPAILRCGFSIPYFLRSLKTRQALRPFPFSLDVLRAWFVSNLQKKCPVLHFGTFLFLPSCYILCIERNIPQ